MAVEIVMPRVDMDMSSGRMGRWHAAEGARVVKGAALFEIETDKAAMEVDAPASGVLKFVAASEGDVLPVGACIGWIVAEGETFVPPAAKAETAAEAHPERDDARPARGARPHPAPQPVLQNGRSSERPMGATFAQGEKAGVRAQGVGGARPRATPAARRIARERGLRLENVLGSGPHGRIQRRDIEAPALAAAGAAKVHRLWLQRGEGAPIVFLHGFGADLNGWRPVHRLLPESSPALAIDLPGHGFTPLGEDASFEALVEAARAALAEEGVSVAHLVGHSLGAAVVASLAHEPGVNALSLMLIAPAGLGEETNAAFFDGFLQADTEAGLTPWLNMLVVDPVTLGSALARTTLRQRQERPLVAEQRRLAQSILAGGRQALDVRSLLGAPRAPTKIVFGIEDRITPAHHADGLSGLIAQHRFARVGHMPHLEARREVARLIEELVRAGGSA
jgi:pimeloyl-ACP methyl ester carboxylesterase